MAGWASNNKYAVLGGMRSVSQVIAYEIPTLLAALSVVLIAQSLNLREIVAAQARGVPFALLQPVAAVLYFIGITAETNRAPFDIPEAESELVGGFHTEYSGMRWAFFFFAEYGSMFVVGGIQAALFLGAWNDPFGIVGWRYEAAVASGDNAARVFWNLVGAGIFTLKAVLIVFVQMWLRWTLPRPRIDQVLYACVKVLLPISFAMLLGASLWQLFVHEKSGIPWRHYNPFSVWAFQGKYGTMVTQIVLAIVLAAVFLAILTWILYAAVTGRGIKQRLTDPAPIDPERQDVVKA
jgi:NADH-quinone oxidoreductase subunit H